MSYLENLPIELQEIIYKHKYHLETKDLQAFADNFDMKIISNIKRIGSKDSWHTSFEKKYNVKINLTYKPSSKSIIMLYFMETNNIKELPSKYDAVHTLSSNAYWFRIGYWSLVRNNVGGLSRDLSYGNYAQNVEGSCMSFKQYKTWTNFVKKIEIMLGDKFNIFMQRYSEERFLFWLLV